MKKSRFSEEQIIAILLEQEAGVSIADVCRRHGVSAATFYKWKAKFGAMSASFQSGGAAPFHYSRLRPMKHA